MSAVARMPGRVAPDWCPYCHGPPGPDCANAKRTPRQIRRQLKTELRRETEEAKP